MTVVMNRVPSLPSPPTLLHIPAHTLEFSSPTLRDHFGVYVHLEVTRGITFAPLSVSLSVSVSVSHSVSLARTLHIMSPIFVLHCL